MIVYGISKITWYIPSEKALKSAMASGGHSVIV